MTISGLARHEAKAAALGMLLMAFAWPLRGQFGHEWGASLTGLFAAAAVSLVPRISYAASFGRSVFFGIFGFVIGSENLPYGALINRILSRPDWSGSFTDLLNLFFIGALWGGTGGAYLGLGLSEKKVSARTQFFFLSAGLLALILMHAGDSAAVTASLQALLFAGILAVNFFGLRSVILQRFAAAGFIFFGAGFLAAVLILHAGKLGMLAGPHGWWTLRDQIWGGLGGAGLLWAAISAHRQGLEPAHQGPENLQRFNFGILIPGVCLLNTWNVYEKWYRSMPPLESPIGAAVLGAGALAVLGAALFFLAAPQTIFSASNVLKCSRFSVLFCAVYLTALAVSKSVVYSGWGVWETGFTLFLITLLVFFSSPRLFFAPPPRPDSTSDQAEL